MTHHSHIMISQKGVTMCTPTDSLEIILFPTPSSTRKVYKQHAVLSHTTAGITVKTAATATIMDCAHKQCFCSTQHQQLNYTFNCPLCKQLHSWIHWKWHNSEVPTCMHHQIFTGILFRTGGGRRASGSKPR
jgi:hypothetical protein